MALLKTISQGDELVFELNPRKEMANRISIFLSDRTGRAATFKISADRSIPIKHYKTLAEAPDRECNPGEVVNQGDELLFDLRDTIADRISISLAGRAGRAAVLVIKIEKPVFMPISMKHFRQASIPQGIPLEGGDAKQGESL